eukprot:2016410-Pleurochrysis_carterae.AAC.2
MPQPRSPARQPGPNTHARVRGDRWRPAIAVKHEDWAIGETTARRAHPPRARAHGPRVPATARCAMTETGFSVSQRARTCSILSSFLARSTTSLTSSTYSCSCDRAQQRARAYTRRPGSGNKLGLCPEEIGKTLNGERLTTTPLQRPGSVHNKVRNWPAYYEEVAQSLRYEETAASNLPSWANRLALENTTTQQKFW